MSIVMEQEVKKRIRGRGILKNITEEGFVIEDEKDGSMDILFFDDLEMFVGKSISISIMEAERTGLEQE